MTKKKETQNTTSQRRNFLKASLATGAGLGAAALSAPALASGRVNLKMVTTWPKMFPGMGTSADAICKRIKDITEGRVNIKLYAGGELVPPLESFDAVQNGTADCYHGPSYYWQGKDPAFAFFTSVPFGMNAKEMEAWVYWGGGQQLWDELYDQYGMKAFMAGQTGTQMGGWFRKEINTPEDLKGLKMRMPGLGGKVLNKIGAAAVMLPGGELFQSLQSGAIDATEWVGPWQDMMMGFYKVAPYYYYPGFHEPGSALEVAFSKKSLEKISKNDQKIIEQICGHEYCVNAAEFNAKSGGALSTLVNKHGVKLRNFSDEIYSTFASGAEEVFEEITAKSPMAKKVYGEYRKFGKDVAKWTELSGGGYAQQRNRVWKF